LPPEECQFWHDHTPWWEKLYEVSVRRLRSLVAWNTTVTRADLEYLESLFRRAGVWARLTHAVVESVAAAAGEE